MTPLEHAYQEGSKRALVDFVKKASAGSWLGKAISTVGTNPAASGAFAGALTGAVSGGQDNRMWGALAGAGLGALGGAKSVGRYRSSQPAFKQKAFRPRISTKSKGRLSLQNKGRMTVKSRGKRFRPGSAQDNANVAASSPVGGAAGGLGGGLTMNMVGLGDKPPTMMPRMPIPGFGGYYG